MDIVQGLDLARDALVMALVVSAPVMVIGMLVGLVVSLFQSMTQLQEQTLSFVPKIVAMVGIGLLLAPWLANALLEYAVELLGESPF
ncbi:MAG: flagellar biosynthetic protein FliQ [Planctomycetes bacterium]|nr:flagellar biosynthetic protein FliQ [Planctomycetota bacterium]